MSTGVSPSLRQNPRLNQWIGFDEPGVVQLSTGKVEIGQGILTALVQIAAEELCVTPAQIRIMTATTQAPNEMFTAGSQSVEASGLAIRAVCADIRESFLDHAAATFTTDRASIKIEQGHFKGPGLPAGLSYWSCRDKVPLDRPARFEIAPRASSTHIVIGTSLPRIDLAAKLSGAAFIHDLDFSGMLHARVIRRPHREARLDRNFLAEVKAKLPSQTELHVRGDFVAVSAGTEGEAMKWAAQIAPKLRWRAERPHDDATVTPDILPTLPLTDRIVESAGQVSGRNAVARVTSTYRRPYLAHASIGPSCAIAHRDGNKLTVWSQSQGVYPLRDALATVLRLKPEQILVQHAQGAGCYGHNGADDVACDAALLAMEKPGRHIRVQWSRQDELSAAPFGAASVVEISAGVDHDGKPTSWSIDIWSPTHSQRPTSRGGAGLLAGYDLDEPQPPMPAGDVPDDNGGGGIRNAFALYDLPLQRLTHHLVTQAPLRTSALRGLGAHANVFAIESFIDELAERAGADPLAWRLSLLSDARARGVIEKVAMMAGGSTATGDRSRGFAFSRYKNKAAYVAIAADVEIDDAISVKEIWCAVDAGLVINPDGARNQVEGGIIQSMSWTLKERVRFNRGGRLPSCWDDYPILKFSEVPHVHVEMIASPSDVPLGVGEVAVGPTAAAIGNAASRALGARLRDLPLSRETIADALLKS